MTGDFAHVKADSRRTYFVSYGPSVKDKGQLPWLLKKPWKARSRSNAEQSLRSFSWSLIRVCFEPKA